MATLKQVTVPDLGSTSKSEVIEITVKPGDTVSKDDSLLTLESEKASMEIPAPFAGVIKEFKVKLGDKIGTGDLILTMEVEESAASEKTEKTEPVKTQAETVKKEESAAPQKTPEKSVTPAAVPTNNTSSAAVHAGPGVRRIAREFGVDLTQVTATGPKDRIVREDVQSYVKSALSNGTGSNGGMGLPQAPIIDFSQFGETETKSLSRIKRYTATNLHRNWLLVPHVTQFDEADITELEAFRKAEQKMLEKQNIKLTPLVFIMKAVVASLKAFPTFNASLAPNGEQLILKKYFNIGIAVDTPEGLVVPVIRDVDKKSLTDLAKELAEISTKARDKGLTPNEMQGGCFAISSLGGIGGTAFTPIVNVPDVAILGVSKAAIKPVYKDNQFVPRLMLPLSLSYDHRVIDGAEGARFIVHLSAGLADIRRWSL